MLSRLPKWAREWGQKRLRVMIYGTLGTACVLALIMSLANPDKYDVSESQVAAVYLTLLVGTNKAFNAKPIYGHRILGTVATFISTGLLPATIIYVALAQIAPGQSAHLETSIGFVIVTVGIALPMFLFSRVIVEMWQDREEKQRQRMIKATPSWVPRLN